MVCGAEAAKERMLAPKGNEFLDGNGVLNQNISHQASIVDEYFMVVGAHLEELIQKKIANNEYVDFAKLLPHDRLTREEDNRMEKVNRDGATFFMPVSDREVNG